MKSVTKKIIAISMALVCAILIVGLVLSLIVVRPLDNMGDYTQISVLSAYDRAYAKTFDQDGNPVSGKALDEAVSTNKFSIMRSMLELGTNYKIRPVTKTIDGEDERVKYDVEAFKNIRAVGSQYMLKLDYAGAITNDRFIDENGDKIIYDTVILVITKGDNKVDDVRLYPYYSANMDNNLSNDTPLEDGRISSEYYNIYEFKAKMYTYKMYNILEENFDQSGTGVA